VIQKDGMVVPIEVKGGNTRANSLKSLMKNHKDISYGYKFADGNIGVGEDGIIAAVYDCIYLIHPSSTFGPASDMGKSSASFKTGCLLG